MTSRLRLLAAAFLLARTLGADPGSAIVRAEVVVPMDGSLSIAVHLRSLDDDRLSREARGLVVSFAEVPPGRYRLEAEAAGRPPAAIELSVQAGETLRVECRLEAGGSQARLLDRRFESYGSSFDRNRLEALPGSRGPFSLLETAETSLIADRFAASGMYAAEPAIASGHGSSWTQVGYALGELDVTDPDRGGQPLLLVDLDALEAVSTATALLPAETAGPGPIVALVPRRPGTSWAGSVQASAMPAGLQADGSTAEAPPIARLASSAYASVQAGGPVVPGRLGLVASAALTRARRIEGDDPREREGRLGSLLTHWVLSAGEADELRLIAAGHVLRRPSSPQADVFARRDDETSLHLQSTWERHARRGSTWAVTGGYQRAVAEPSGSADLSGPGTVERLLDGPVTELPFPVRSARARWDIWARGHPAVTRALGLEHALSLGAGLGGASVDTRPTQAIATIGESLDGLPARVWDYGWAGPESRWTETVASLWAADHVEAGSRLDADVALRLDSTSSSARGGEEITWHALSPRFSGRLRLTESGLAAFAGWSRLHHLLPLRMLAFGDPAGPAGLVYRWDDRNTDGVVQAGERGPLVARVGPGGSIASIAPDLGPPHTDELLAGLEAPMGAFVARLVGVRRRSRGLLESVNVGVPLSSYGVRLLPDPGGDLLSSADDQLLPVYDRDPASFGRDSYLLTSPEGLTSLHEGVELTIERRQGAFRVLVGATASRSSGSAAYRGFRVRENDPGLVGELLDDPNADTYAHGRLFFDRAYTIKLSLSHVTSRHRLALVARYQDGQPFARLVVVPGLGQGPEAVRAVPNGRHRFTYTLTVDARAEQSLPFARHRLSVLAEAFNLLGSAKEVEEDVVGGPGFRTVTATQPPRALRLGVRWAF